VDKIISQKYITGLVFLFVILLNFCIKILGISYNQVALDEPFSIYYSQFSVKDIVSTLLQGNNPPVYELFLHYWITLFGIDVISVRLPSVIFSSLAAGIFFLVAKRTMPLGIALGTGLIFTFSLQFIYFSHEARSYALLICVLMLATLFFLKSADKPSNKFVLLLASLTAALAVYVHYLALIPIALFLVSFVFYWVNKRNAIFLLYPLFTLLFLSPLLFYVFKRISQINETGLWGNSPEWTQLYGFLNIFLNGKLSTLLLGILLITGIVILKFTKMKIEYQKHLIWPFLFFGSYIILFFVSFRAPLFIERYVQIAIPFLYLSVGVFFTIISAHKKWFHFAFALFIIGILIQTDIYPDNNRKPHQAAIKAEKFKTMNPDGAVILSPFWIQYGFTYYYNSDIFKSANLDSALKEESIFSIWDKPGAERWIQEYKTEYSRILFIDGDEAFLKNDNLVFSSFSDRYLIMAEFEIDEATKVYELIHKDIL